MKPALLLSACLACLPLAACGGGAAPRKVVSAPAPLVKPPLVRPPYHPAPPHRAVAQVLPGLEGVIGSTGADLARQFGPARLDVWEGDARKLQFSGSACVLDVYLYPPAQGAEPQATYTDARRASDGRDVDRASCIAALRKR